MQTIDYSRYSLYELYQALESIDREQFPDNYQALIAELERRKASQLLPDDQQPYFAGFWRRLFAHLFDTMLITLVSLLLVIIFFDSLKTLHHYGLLVGFMLSAAYYSIGNSHLLNGQTLGKNLLDIQVTDLNGRQISVPRAFGRYLTFDFPLYLLPFTALWLGNHNGLIFALSLVAGLMLFISQYLFCFNRPTRRTLHDYLAATIVVNVAAQPKPVRRIWKGHYYVLLALCLLLTAFASSSFIQQQATAATLQPIVSQLEQNNYRVKGVSEQSFSHPAMGDQPIRILSIVLYHPENKQQPGSIASQVFELIKALPQLQSYSRVNIAIIDAAYIGTAFKVEVDQQSFTVPKT